MGSAAPMAIILPPALASTDRITTFTDPGVAAGAGPASALVEEAAAGFDDVAAATPVFGGGSGTMTGIAFDVSAADCPVASVRL